MVSDNIKKLRKTLKLSQSEFGKRIGKTLRGIQGWEYGDRTLSDSSILLICSTFGVNEHWLRTGEGEMFQSNPEVPQEFELRCVSLPKYGSVADWKRGQGNGTMITDIDLLEGVSNYHICFWITFQDSVKPINAGQYGLLTPFGNAEVSDGDGVLYDKPGRLTAMWRIFDRGDTYLLIDSDSGTQLDVPKNKKELENLYQILWVGGGYRKRS